MVLRLQAQLRGQLTRTGLGAPTPASLATNTAGTASRRDVLITLDMQGQALQWKLDKLLAQAGAASLNMRGTAQRQATDQPWRITGEAQLREFDPRPWWREDPAQPVDAALAQTPSDVNANAQWDVQLPPRPASGSTMNWVDLWRGQAALDLQPSQLAGVALQGRAKWRHQGKDPAELQVALDAEGNRVNVEAMPKSLAQPDAGSPLNLTVDAPELQRLSPLWRLLGGPVEAGSKQAPLSGTLKARVSLSRLGPMGQDLLNSRSSGQVWPSMVS